MFQAIYRHTGYQPTRFNENLTLPNQIYFQVTIILLADRYKIIISTY